MSSLELMAMDGLGRGWLLILAFTAAVLVVVALRKPCRRWFGAERAFQLWSLVLLAMLVSQLPHATSTSLTALPALVYMITSVAGVLPSHAGTSAGIGWRSLVMLAWCAGTAIAVLSAAFAQWRYRNHLRAATSMADASSRWPALRATAAKAGWTLVNPDALGNAPVTLSFNDMSAGTAMQRVADLAGVKLVLEGKQVRFENK